MFTNKLTNLWGYVNIAPSSINKGEKAMSDFMHDDIIDSRDIESYITEMEEDIADIEEAIHEMEEEIMELRDDEYMSDDELADKIYDLEQKIEDAKNEIDAIESELNPVREFAETAKAYSSDWNYGTQIINDDYFVEYAQQVADDMGLGNMDMWPFDHIDWESAADALKMDYTAVNFGEKTYWVKG